MRSTILYATLAGIVLSAPLTASAQPAAGSPMPPPAKAERIRVGIVPGLAVNLEPARVDALGQDLAAALAQQLDIDAVGGLEVRRALPAEGIPDDCLTTPACVKDVAARLHTNQLLFVVMVDTGAAGAVQIDSTWVDIATGHQEQRPAIDIAQLSDAKPRFAASASLLLPDAPVRKTEIENAVHDQVVPGEPRHFTKLSVITGAAALVGVGFGIGFGLKTRSDYQQCDDNPSVCSPDLDDRKDRIRRNGAIADVGFGVALAGAVATGILFMTSGTESHVIVAPSTGPEGPGVTFSATGRF